MKTRLRKVLFPVCIRYDNESFADGFGAQALRLIGIFSITQHYRLRYEHRNLQFEHPDELLGPHSSQENYLNAMKDISELLKLPNNGLRLRQKQVIINMRSITRRQLFKIIFKSLFSNSETVINLQLPQGITDYRPEILEFGAQFVRENLYRLYPTLTNAIVVHVRTGNRTIKTPRFNSLPQLNPEYYNEALNMIESSQAKKIFHTDLFPIDFLENTESIRFQKFQKFLEEHSKSQHNQMSHYAPILTTLCEMATAKVLIMSNSALSYFAGILNENTVIWPPIHGHAKLRRWLKGPDLTSSSISFIDSTDYSRQESIDHRIYRKKFENLEK
jgi:hypothetical protein